MKGIVDRFEGDFVVIEIDGETQDIPKALVEDSVQVNDCVTLQHNKWRTVKSETEIRKNTIKSLMDSVWED
ncbi:DUF3006 domain-containing protein [Sporosarcina sp. FSL K6-1522]|uniref:DUF3006 domain-containing protein n=1 Tax=Sporosarcina sp. FSL K6-1522 TaxID=2921554 RepID=UPI00315A3D61